MVDGLGVAAPLHEVAPTGAPPDVDGQLVALAIARALDVATECMASLQVAMAAGYLSPELAARHCNRTRAVLDAVQTVIACELGGVR